MKKSIDGAKDKVDASEVVDEIDRSIIWKKSRQNKNGEYDNEDIGEQAAMIVKINFKQLLSIKILLILLRNVVMLVVG